MRSVDELIPKALSERMEKRVDGSEGSTVHYVRSPGHQPTHESSLGERAGAGVFIQVKVRHSQVAIKIETYFVCARSTLLVLAHLTDDHTMR